MSRLSKDKGSLAFDDRLDVLAMAVNYWVEQLARDQEYAVKQRKDDLKREELDNRTNGFSEQVKALVAKASAGDIYIFEQISVLCPSYSAPKFIKSVVYTIE